MAKQNMSLLIDEIAKILASFIDLRSYIWVEKNTQQIVPNKSYIN